MNVLITGGSSGIGKSIVDYLKQHGFTVYWTSRNPKKSINEEDDYALKLDINSTESINELILELKKRNVFIDVLINNAGIGICGSIEETSEELAREQIETNFWGSVNVSRAFLPIMRKQNRGKIIFISSLAGLIGVPYQGYYAASKHAIEGFAKSLFHEVKEFNISVSCLEPGFHKSNLHHSFKYADALISDYDASREQVLKVFHNSIENAPDPINIAKVVYAIIKSKSPKLSYRVGTDAKMLPILQFFSKRLFSWGTRKKFMLPR